MAVIYNCKLKIILWLHSLSLFQTHLHTQPKQETSWCCCSEQCLFGCIRLKAKSPSLFFFDATCMSHQCYRQSRTHTSKKIDAMNLRKDLDDSVALLSQFILPCDAPVYSENGPSTVTPPISEHQSKGNSFQNCKHCTMMTWKICRVDMRYPCGKLGVKS